MLTIPVTIKSLYCFFQVSGEGNATSGLWPQDLIGLFFKILKIPRVIDIQKCSKNRSLYIGLHDFVIWKFNSILMTICLVHLGLAYFNIIIFFAGCSYCNKRRSEYFKDWWNWQSSDNVWTTWGEDCTCNISILINMSYKHSEVFLSTFWSFFCNLHLLSKIVRQDNYWNRP